MNPPISRKEFSYRTEHVGTCKLQRAIVYKWFFKKWDREAWTGLILLRIEKDGSGNKHSISDNHCSDSG